MASDAFEIRRYRPADADRVRALHEVAMREVDAYVEDAPDEDLRDVEGAYLEEDSEFLVGEREGAVVAMGALKPVDDGTFVADAALRPDDGPAAEVTRMRVDPAHQRQGYGTRILAELEARAAELGYQVLVLDTTARQEGARRLYEGFGYERVETVEWREYEMLLYRKELTG